MIFNWLQGKERILYHVTYVQSNPAVNRFPFDVSITTNISLSLQIESMQAGNSFQNLYRCDYINSQLSYYKSNKCNKSAYYILTDHSEHFLHVVDLWQF